MPSQKTRLRLIQAFQAMLGDIRAADCSDRQITGIIVWQAYVANAVAHAHSCQGVSGLTVPWTRSDKHAFWRASAGLILAALKEQENEASWRSAGAAVAARRHKNLAAEARDAGQKEETAAVAASRLAVRYRRAGDACTDPQEAAHYYALAREADATAARHMKQASDYYKAANRHEEEAARLRGLAAAFNAWAVAARDAQAIGRQLIATEDGVAMVIGRAIDAAGGVVEVPKNKRYMRRDGARAPAMNGGGR